MVPPGTGICHQVNLEYLSQTVWTKKDKVKVDGKPMPMEVAYPDTLVGTDSHTTMVNGLAVLGWGVGGIEAEAAMLGQPYSMLLPEVIGVKLTGKLKEGVTATDLVLTVTQMLRKRGVVGKFVEFFGPGLANLSIADRATIGNMSPEYGATCGFFPVDDDTLRYLRDTGAASARVALVAAYAKAQGMYRTKSTPDPIFTDVLKLELSQVEPSLAGPKRPQDRVALKDVKAGFAMAMEKEFNKGGDGGKDIFDLHPSLATSLDKNFGKAGASKRVAGRGPQSRSRPRRRGDRRDHLLHQHVEPERDGRRRPAGAQGRGQGLDREALGQDLAGAGLAGRRRISRQVRAAEGPRQARLQSGRLRLHHLHRQFRAARAGNLQDHQRSGSGRRRGAVRQPQLRGPRQRRRARELSRLAAAGRRLCARRLDVFRSGQAAARPRQEGQEGLPQGHLADAAARSTSVMRKTITKQMFTKKYADVFKGDAHWRKISVKGGADLRLGQEVDLRAEPAVFRRHGPASGAAHRHRRRARARLLLDSITTDHISPAGSIKVDSPAGKYLIDHKVKPVDFNQYGTRRGNHEVMMRGTFANIRLKNQMVPGVEGGVTVHYPSRAAHVDLRCRHALQEREGAARGLRRQGIRPGSSRDWAAKGANLLGVRAVVCQSFERIHRSNLIGMGVLPLCFEEGTSWQTLGLKGDEQVTIRGLHGELKPRQRLIAEIVAADGGLKRIPLICRIDTLDELDYFKHGGILQYVLRHLVAA